MFFEIDDGLFKLNLIDHHAILGIPLDAQGNQVRKSYLKIAAKIHPDTCKFKDQEEAEYAGQILSKLVNPAYEYLSKATNLQEHNLILSQTGKSLSGKPSPALKFPEAQRLYQSGSNVKSSYHTLVATLSKELFVDINATLEKITLLSELNLVYLLLTSSQGETQKVITQTPPPKPPESTATTTGTNGSKVSQGNTTFTGSKIRSRYSRAEELIKKENFSEAIIELRDRLKEDPVDPITHSLLGYAFLKQKQIGMAKIHAKKALEFDPNNTVATKTLDAILRSTDTAGLSKKEVKKGGLFGGMFGGKKK